MKTYHQRMREIREDHDLTQEQVAGILKISQRAYSSYETGNRKLPIDLLIVLATHYGVSADYMLGLTDNSAPYPRSQ